MTRRQQQGPDCDYCHSGALYLVTRDVPGSPAAHACKSHLAIAADKVAERSGGGSLSVYLLSGGSDLGGGAAHVERVLEQVRRVGAFSASDPAAARKMEADLFRGVLALIAQGAVNPAGLATAALMTHQYDLGRQET